MRDTTSARWTRLDALFLLLVQALPLPLLLLLAALRWGGVGVGAARAPLDALLAANAALVAVRLLLGVAMARSFARRGAAYWLSPLADPAAALRVVQTMMRRPREWRGAPPGGG
jgi:dolichol-phosphate mannosyltransferase